MHVPNVSCFDGPQAIFSPFFHYRIFHAFFCARKCIPFDNIPPSFICTYHECINCFNTCSWLQFKVFKFKKITKPSNEVINSTNDSPVTRCCTKKESITNQTLFYPAHKSEGFRVGAVSGTARRERNQEKGERATIGHGFGGTYLIRV